VQAIFTGVGLEKNQEYDILCSVFKDNSGALTFVNLELPRMTPRSKHYAVKNWFRACLKPENTRVLKVESEHQMANIYIQKAYQRAHLKISGIHQWDGDKVGT